MTLKYLLNFIVIGDEWTAVPGASVEVACSVTIYFFADVYFLDFLEACSLLHEQQQVQVKISYF